MLVNFWLSETLRGEAEVSFSFRQCLAYEIGMLKAIVPDFPVYRMRLSPVSWPFGVGILAGLGATRILRYISRIVFGIPFFIFDVWVMYRLVRKIRPDVVHLNNGGYPAARSVRAAAIGAKIAGCPSVVMVINNLARPYTSFDRCVEYLADRLVVGSTTMFVTGSVAAAKRLASVLKLDTRHVQSIPNGVRLGERHESVEMCRARLGVDKNFDGVVFGVVALLVERKGHRVLIDAINQLAKSCSNLSKELVVLIEGNGPLKNELERMASVKGIEKMVRFVGDEKNIVDFMAAIDVLILSSIDLEDFPNVILEAMALGKAVIASSLAGTPEQVVEGVTGFLVKPGDSDELAQAISEFVHHPERGAYMGREGLARFRENFTPEIAVKKYIQLYDSIRGRR